MVENSYPGAAAALTERRAGVVEKWLAVYGRSVLRLPRPLDLRELSGLANAVAEALAAGLAEPGAAPGAQPLREAEKAVAFAGGSLGMSGASAFDVAAFLCALRDVLVGEALTPTEASALARLCDWFCALAQESYSTSVRDAQKLRYRDSLERGTPVVMIAPEVPAALLVGEPDRAVLDATFGRLLLATVRVGARAVIIDGGGLEKPDAPEVEAALATFAGHRKMEGVEVVLTGLVPEVEARWRAAFPAEITVSHEERFESAVARSLAASGLRLARA